MGSTSRPNAVSMVRSLHSAFGFHSEYSFWVYRTFGLWLFLSSELRTQHNLECKLSLRLGRCSSLDACFVVGNLFRVGGLIDIFSLILEWRSGWVGLLFRIEFFNNARNSSRVPYHCASQERGWPTRSSAPSQTLRISGRCFAASSCGQNVCVGGLSYKFFYPFCQKKNSCSGLQTLQIYICSSIPTPKHDFSILCVFNALLFVYIFIQCAGNSPPSFIWKSRNTSGILPPQFSFILKSLCHRGGEVCAPVRSFAVFNRNFAFIPPF